MTTKSTIFKFGDLAHADITFFRGDFKECITQERYFDLILTSPPYNIGSASPKYVGRRKLGGYDRKSWGAIEGYADAMPEDEYQASQRAFLVWCARAIKDNGVIIYNHKLRHKNGRLIKPDSWFPPESVLVLHDEIVWDKGSTHNHCNQFTYPQSERLYVFKKPEAQIHFENQNFYWDKSPRAGIGDTWRIPREWSNGHNAPFPLKLVRQCIRMWSPAGGVVCDPYCGSGTTMIAAFLEGRSFVGAEILAKYHEMAITRFKTVVKSERGSECWAKWRA